MSSCGHRKRLVNLTSTPSFSWRILKQKIKHARLWKWAARVCFARAFRVCFASPVLLKAVEDLCNDPYYWQTASMLDPSVNANTPMFCCQMSARKRKTQMTYMTALLMMRRKNNLNTKKERTFHRQVHKRLHPVTATRRTNWRGKYRNNSIKTSIYTIRTTRTKSWSFNDWSSKVNTSFSSVVANQFIFFVEFKRKKKKKQNNKKKIFMAVQLMTNKKRPQIKVLLKKSLVNVRLLANQLNYYG